MSCVGSFELLDGFGFMSNVYDPFDLVADALGVAIAFALDLVLKDRADRRANE